MAPKRKTSSQQPRLPPRPSDLNDGQPLSVDWTREGVTISEIRQQGQDSRVAEGVYNKQAKEDGWRKRPKAGSVQHLTNCVKPGTKTVKHGCLLTLTKGYKFMESNRLAREQDLPFQGGKQFRCDPRRVNWHQAIQVVGHEETSSETNVIDEKVILDLLTKHPVAVTLVESSELISSGHQSRIYRWPTEIDTPPRDHAMLLVGYKTTSAGINIFLAQNSWGTNWGDVGIGKIIWQSSSGRGKSLFKTFSYPKVFLG